MIRVRLTFKLGDFSGIAHRGEFWDGRIATPLELLSFILDARITTFHLYPRGCVEHHALFVRAAHGFVRRACYFPSLFSDEQVEEKIVSRWNLIICLARSPYDDEQSSSHAYPPDPDDPHGS